MFHYFHIVIFFLFASLSAKKTVKSFSFRELKENSWRYLTKFGYERGTGSFNIKAKILNPIKNSLYPYEQLRFQLSIFLDIEFPQALEKPSCGEKNAWSRYLLDLLLFIVLEIKRFFRFFFSVCFLFYNNIFNFFSLNYFKVIRIKNFNKKK